MDFDDSALDMGQPAPKAAPKAAPKTAPKTAGGSKPAPKTEPAPPVPQGAALPPVDERNQFREERATARKAYDEKQDDDFYRQKREKVAASQAAGELGTAVPPKMFVGGPLLEVMNALYERSYPEERQARIGPIGAKPVGTTPGGRIAYETRPQLFPEDIPSLSKGGSLRSVDAFRQKAEELGLRYGAAQKEMREGVDRIAAAQEATSTDLPAAMPPLAAKQRELTQRFSNAREALRQMGLTDAEMEQKFAK